MNGEKNKLSLWKILVTIIVICCIVTIVEKGIDLLKNISQICVVEEGSLTFEETADSYILRDEKVLQGENYKNGMIQIVSEGQRVAKNEPAFRYYSNGENEILTQIDTLDDEINATIESAGLTIFSTDITNLETQIEKVVDSMYGMNDIDDIQDKISELDNFISKKTKIAGNLSPEDSHIKALIDQRNTLESQISSGSEVMISPVSGLISYRVDDLEEILRVDDFSYLNSDFLKKLQTKSGSIITMSEEKGKVIDNFKCYIASVMNTEKASVAKVDDEVKIRLPSGEEIEASIVYVAQEEGNNRVIVFEITDCVEELIQYREIPIDIIWWSYKGLKISNSAIQEENDISYVQKSKAGYTEKIYVKVLRQNDTFSIVENYTNEELTELGFDEKYINSRLKLNVYDEILMY